MSLGNRIRTLRKAQGLSQPALAKKAGVTQSTISDLENDKKGTSAENLMAIARVLETSQDYLLTGSESHQPITLKGSSENPVVAQIRKNYSIFQNELELHEYFEIKYFDGGDLSRSNESFSDFVAGLTQCTVINGHLLREKGIVKENCIAVSLSDNAMFPTIKDKDIVYVDLGRKSIKDGKVFAVCHGGLFKFKRLYQLPLGGVRIVSDNAVEYPEERLTAQEIIDQQFEVIGWVWSWQSLENW